jgi:hypothetical protein
MADISQSGLITFERGKPQGSVLQERRPRRDQTRAALRHLRLACRRRGVLRVS